MTTPTSGGPPRAPTPTSAPPTSGSNGPPPVATPSVSQFVTSVYAIAGYSATGTNGNGKPGVPALPSPNFSPVVDTDLLGAAVDEITAQLFKGQKQKLAESATKQKTLSTQALEQQNKSLQSLLDLKPISEAEKALKVFQAVMGVIGAVLGCIAAAAATGASGGALALLGFAAGMGAVMAINNLVNVCIGVAEVMVKDKNGKDIPLDVSFGGLVRVIADQPGMCPFADDSPEKAKWVAGWTAYINIVVAVTCAAAGGLGAFAATASKVADVVSATAKVVTQVSTVLGDVAQGVTAVTQATEAGLNITSATIQKSGDDTRAELAYTRAMLSALSSAIKNDTGLIQQISAMRNGFYQMVADIQKSDADVSAKRSHAMT
jgi:hypothetical protein